MSPSAVERDVVAGEDLSALERLRVLVVEDNVVNQKVAQRFLERMGCEVELIADGSTQTLRVRGPKPGTLKGIRLDMSDIGELAPTVAAIAATCSGVIPILISGSRPR